ncbi:MAG: phosphoadenylyl-sulfate reductase [Candidatus Nitricoxidivorans perseverans]|uniref:Adenosine 5'-phosphosulfate reductase n=1 Tax=Candidatus Nitricoxidivorans perseverans TaxID=2975601 RepID=A0AA49IX54_9PROT|nr:MAG: phosphoadenylyl-sulfate reductase [Candidatus Nitricoxidivorans perseverans]
MHRNTFADIADRRLAVAVNRKAAAATRLLTHAARDFAPAAFSSSLGAEDQVVTDLIFKAGIDIEIFSLDTGRLPPETYEALAETERHYGRRIAVYYPRHDLIEEYVRNHGINGFYDSIDNRKACCQARKVEPLRRALAGKKGWVTGLRAEQAATRGNLKPLVHDEAFDLVKVNPLADWSEREVWAYIRANGVPYNKLHDRNTPSIGCAPCTRAISSGEDVRAGRWWWESPETKECGLHAGPAGSLVRASA